LDEIRLEGETATEQAIQESLDHWRKFIALVEINLPRLEEDLERFARFAYPEKIPRPVRAIVDEVTIHIDNAIDQAATLESTLQADMSVIESRPGIAEAASVTKITELAFIFTPLTFSASLFSMQIKEARGGMPLRTFISSAVLVVALSYSVRLLVRSKTTIRIKSVVLGGVIRYTGLPRGGKIPTRAALS
jgi:Mg2+ and Co2+ transporter CorA